MPESALVWIKASSSVGNGACVELAVAGDSILIRHSRHPDKQLQYSRAEIEAFFDGVRNREFDHLTRDP